MQRARPILPASTPIGRLWGVIVAHLLAAPLLTTLLLMGGVGLLAPTAHALPIGFGKNQGEQVYHELKSDNFFVYFDRDAPHEAAGILRSLEAGKPVIEYWLGRSRLEPLPVILSSKTSNASFANFITDALELQTRGKGGRDLAWHEFVHNAMYLHLDNFLGPAGSIIYLPFMPSWWIEGLAETIAMSHGSSDMLAVERHAALNDAFPTFARLHSLYGHSGFARPGYAISAAFVTYIFKTYGYDKLIPILKDFYRYAQPWYWAWAAVPFNGFLPMDKALENATGKNAEELYKEYKAARIAYWREATKGQGAAAPYTYEAAWYTPRLSQHKGVLTARFDGSQKAGLYSVRLPPKGERDTVLPMSQALIVKEKLPQGTREKAGNRRYQVRLTERDFITRLELWQPRKNAASGKTFWRRQLATRSKRRIARIGITDRSVSYWVQGMEDSGLCYRMLDRFNAEVCPIMGRGPVSIEPIDGGRKGRYRWLSRKVETSVGTEYTLLRFDKKQLRVEELPVDAGGRPLDVQATDDGGYWLLADTYQGRRLRRLTSEGRCAKEASLPYASRQFEILGPHTLIVDAFSPNGTGLVQVNVRSKAFTQCTPSFARMSPLIYQLATAAPLTEGSFATAVQQGGLGGTLDPAAVPVIRKAIRQHASALVAQNSQPVAAAKKDSSFALTEDLATNYQVNSGELAKHRFRPVFAFPWLGSDSEGLTLGIVSVPLMDHRQNHSLRLNFLYGLQSRFPNTELHYRNTRYRPTIDVKAFRYQTYNGTWAFEDEDPQVYYYDEIGASIAVRRRVLPWLSLGLGAQLTHLEPYIGPESFFDTERQGMRALISGTFGAGTKLGPFYLSMAGTASVAPEPLNEAWDYQKFRLATKVALPFRLLARTHQVSWGLQLGVTEGDPSKTPLLRETYRPLQTHIPGGGGVSNQFHFSIVGLGGLTTALNGDRSYRNEVIYTVPLFPDLDTLWGILYMERLDFSLFYNYGNAWYDGFPASEGDPIEALGYALDLQSDMKGVTLNFGLGAGKVLGEDLAYYGRFGFNALID